MSSEKGYYNVYTDGGARGNPGPAGCGVYIERCKGGDCKEVLSRHKFLPQATNNGAEYGALLLALEELLSLQRLEKVNFYLDSQLVVEQMLGNYRVKNRNLAALFDKVNVLLKRLGCKASFTYIPRERNQKADNLVNQAIDEGLAAAAE